ncbi:hypothetical protein J5N97_015379 [Dioscorea zingiberensis]|uniref:Bet v I/Major latex protein domain-containing protein n=1 Tax=Dioscorea zingiberensis TaxID=325984 RepID=A0A9D5HKE7_9LILI|nr:hypothetical protein J5N97_015379 [Dioscorea zingiberensis]
MSWSVEVESSVSAGRLFKAVVLDWHTVGPKAIPEIIKSASVVHVDGGVGSVRQINFTPVGPFPYAKERLDFLDANNFEAKQSLIEGGGLGKKLESASSHIKFIPTNSGGCICKVTATYKPLPGCNSTEEETKAKEGFTKIVKASEAYLLANPTVCA